MAENREAAQGKVTFWHMWRDVLVTAMNKGQFPLALLGLILIVILIKLPSETISKLTSRLYGDLKNLSLVGYVMWVLTMAAWYAHARLLRRTYAMELSRLSAERTRLQDRQLGDLMSSSED